MALSGAALKGLTIYSADEIDSQNVTGFRCPLLFDRNAWLVAIGDVGQGLCHLIITSLKGWPLNGQLAKIRHGYFRHHLTGQRRFKVLAVLIAFDIDIWLACQTQIIALNRLFGTFIKRRLDGIALSLRTKAGFDHGHRHLAGTKARHIHGLGKLGQFFQDLRLDLSCSDHN